MKVSTYLVALALALSGLLFGAGPASAHATMAPEKCSGTLAAPGLLAGTYPGDVVIDGVCAVDGGAAVVNGDLTLSPGSALNATFALNDVTHKGTSSLKVRGDLRVLKGAVLVMGCLPVHSPCSDDPHAMTGGTLTGKNHVYGSLTGSWPLGIIVHASKIGGSVEQVGDGGGVTCKVPTSGVFAALQSPVFSDYEDNWIGGSVSVAKLRTCWFGALRDHVGGSFRLVDNKFADPDANETNSNFIGGSMSCFKNSPAVQFGFDSVGAMSNKVQGSAEGECGFDVLLHNPAPSGPLTPISVRG